MKDFSAYQQKVIRNYYQNRDALALQRLQELATDLYLAEGKKRAKIWDQVRKSLEKSGLSAARIDHVVSSDNPAMVVQVVEELMAKEDAPAGKRR